MYQLCFTLTVLNLLRIGLEIGTPLSVTRFLDQSKEETASNLAVCVPFPQGSMRWWEVSNQAVYVCHFLRVPRVDGKFLIVDLPGYI